MSESDLEVARRAKVEILRDFVTWAGKLSDVPGAFQHNSLVEAAAAMADFIEQGRPMPSDAKWRP